MAFLPQLMTLFGGKTPEAPAPVPTPSDPAATPGASAGTNPSVPSATTPTSDGSVAAIPAAGTGNASPLENFKDLWNIDDKNKPAAPPSLIPSLNLDPKGIREAAAKIDFTGHIPEEVITKALAGDKASFLSVINQAAQLGFANAVAANGEVVKHSLSSAQDVLKDSVLPQAFRAQQISDAIDATNPVFQDPAVAPMLSMVKQQLMLKYPTADAAAIADMAVKYVGGVATKFVTSSGGTVVSKEQQQQQQKGNFQLQKDPDWESYFGAV